MFHKRIFLFITVLALAALACGFNINLPGAVDIQTGPTQTEEISLPDPDPAAETVSVELNFGAGELTLRPGGQALLEGTATYNVADLKPISETGAGRVELRTGNLEISGIPRFSGSLQNTWDLRLGSRPLNLRINAGAYAGDLELGGLALTGLHISDGASDVRLNFSEPNSQVLETLRYETGASSVRLSNLGNANFRSLVFKGGAGNYELDFGGVWQADAAVAIEAGLSSLSLSVPEGLNVRVTLEGGFSNATTHGSWSQSGKVYTLAGDGPTLDVTISMGAGNITLSTP